MAVKFENAAELVKRLGNIPLDRICFTPPPGTATLRNLRAPAPLDPSTNSSMARWWRKRWDSRIHDCRSGLDGN